MAIYFGAKMDRVFLCYVLLLSGGLVYSQLLSTGILDFGPKINVIRVMLQDKGLFYLPTHQRSRAPEIQNEKLNTLSPIEPFSNVRLVNHIPYILEVMETTMKDMEEHGWCNLKIPPFEVPLDENVLGWHVKGRVTFSNAFVTSIQKVDIIQNTVQQIWRFDNTDNTTSVFAQATLRMTDVALGYDIQVDLDDGSHHYFTGIFKHDTAQFPFAVIYNMFTEEFSVSVTMITLPRSTNKMVFAPATALSQVLSYSYDVTSAAEGMEAWGPEVFEPILLNVATHKVHFPEICYNCPVQ